MAANSKASPSNEGISTDCFPALIKGLLEFPSNKRTLLVVDRGLLAKKSALLYPQSHNLGWIFRISDFSDIFFCLPETYFVVNPSKPIHVTATFVLSFTSFRFPGATENHQPHKLNLIKRILANWSQFWRGWSPVCFKLTKNNKDGGREDRINQMVPSDSKTKGGDSQRWKRPPCREDGHPTAGMDREKEQPPKVPTLFTHLFPFTSFSLAFTYLLNTNPRQELSPCCSCSPVP